MNTIAYRAPRFSRAKALIAALFATLAIAGAVQATAPDSAAAMPSRCATFYGQAETAYMNGYDDLGDFYLNAYLICIGF